MRMIVHVTLPNEPFNSYVKDGSAGPRMQKILAEMKPEAVYFVDYGGRRGGIIVVNIDDSSKVPGLAEPWFLVFNAQAEFHIAMTPEDLAKSGLDAIGKKWA